MTASDMIAEYNGSNTLQRRYVHGPGDDEPLMVADYTTGVTSYYGADNLGSITTITNGATGAYSVNTYNEYGLPGSGNTGRFQYTGQIWLPEIGMYNYKARLYNPAIGRFMQTDPIGYGDGMNWYNYVHSDPVNGTDPSGLGTVETNCVTITTSYYWAGSNGQRLPIASKRICQCHSTELFAPHFLHRSLIGITGTSKISQRIVCTIRAVIVIDCKEDFQPCSKM